MRKLILLTLAGGALLLGVCQLGWMAVRGFQAYSDIEGYFSVPSDDPVHAVVERGRLTLYVDNSPYWSIGSGESEARNPRESADEDSDSDGLTYNRELLSLTSDKKKDTDGDGVLDDIDSSPNTSSINPTVEGSVVTVVLRAHAKAMGYLDEPQLIAQHRTSYGGCFSATDLPYTVICATDLEMVFLRMLGVERVFRFEEIVEVPGFVYVVFSWHDCGTRCADGKYFVVWDVPLIGPRVVGTFGHHVG